MGEFSRKQLHNFIISFHFYRKAHILRRNFKNIALCLRNICNLLSRFWYECDPVILKGEHKEEP